MTFLTSSSSSLPASSSLLDWTSYLSKVRIQQDDFDVQQELNTLRQGDDRVGAVCSFVGTVRGLSNTALVGMTLEHYPQMTERAIAQMMAQAHQRFDIMGALVIHRVGRLALQDQIVLVAVTSSHRGASFMACEFLMDYLKTQAPFWKQEHFSNGDAQWVAAKAQDDEALARWGIEGLYGNQTASS